MEINDSNQFNADSEPFSILYDLLRRILDDRKGKKVAVLQTFLPVTIHRDERDDPDN
jgi:hypothetical protein